MLVHCHVNTKEAIIYFHTNTLPLSFQACFLPHPTTQHVYLLSHSLPKCFSFFERRCMMRSVTLQARPDVDDIAANQKKYAHIAYTLHILCCLSHFDEIVSDRRPLSPLANDAE